MHSGIVLWGASCPEGTNGHAAAHALLSLALAETWGWTDTPPMARGARGKPFFPDWPERQFNLSHTQGLCLCALSGAGEVGVDIERVRPRRENLPRYVMSETELSAFDGTWEDFTRIWTLKEAFCKLQGTSVYPPTSVPVPPPSLYRSYAGEGWRAALCAQAGVLPEEILWARL